MSDTSEFFKLAISAAGFTPPEHIRQGKLQRFSSNGRRTDTSGWCRLFRDGRAGVFGDFRSGVTHVWVAKDEKPPTLVQRQQRFIEIQRAKAEAAAEQSIQWAQAANKNAGLWAESFPVAHHDCVDRYLSARGIHLECWPGALHYHPSLEYWQDGRCIGHLPAMIAEVTDLAGLRVSLHRTYLTHDGQKANVEIVKKLTASSARLAGCSIKLGQPSVIKGLSTIAVAEGIETALACHAASTMPTVSAISANGVERYQWPDEVQQLVVFADNDISQVGQKAAAALADRARSRGLKVGVLTPPDSGTDWADVWAAQEGGI